MKCFLQHFMNSSLWWVPLKTQVMKWKVLSENSLFLPFFAWMLSSWDTPNKVTVFYQNFWDHISSFVLFCFCRKHIFFVSVRTSATFPMNTETVKKFMTCFGLSKKENLILIKINFMEYNVSSVFCVNSKTKEMYSGTMLRGVMANCLLASTFAWLL